MKFSTRARYGARAMLDLAVHHAQRPVNIKEMAERQEVSATYLEQLMLRLVSHGLVRTIRGRGGGFVLSRHPSSIVLDEVVEALEGPVVFVECVANPGLCHRSPSCVTHDIWKDVAQDVADRLGRISLEDMAQRHRGKQEARALMYYI